MSAGRRTILFIHPGGLGDVVLSLPAIRSVRQAFPSHALALLAGAQVGRLLRACGEVDLALPLEGDHFTGLLAGPDCLAPGLRTWLSRCDLAVGWLADHEGRLAATLRAVGVESVVVRSPMQGGREGSHQTERFLETVAAIAPASSRGRTLRLPAQIRAQGREWVEANLSSGAGPLVAVHPGSGSRHKCCRPGLLAQTVTWFQDNGAGPLLVQGPADTDLITAVQRSLARPVPAIRGLDLLAMAGVLVQAALFIGHDSGLTHVAAALGIRTVAFFGPTDVRRWRPLGSHVSIVTGAPCRCLSWDLVTQCTEKPCLLIPVEQLLAACRERLSLAAETVDKRDWAGADSCHVR